MHKWIRILKMPKASIYGRSLYITRIPDDLNRKHMHRRSLRVGGKFRIGTDFLKQVYGMIIHCVV